MVNESSIHKKIESFIGTELEGRYQIISVLGYGGMGVVYKAQHLFMDRRVAIKMILDGGYNYDLPRFQQEARAAAALSHPNIITVFDFGINPFPYMVMDYLEGHSLSEILRARRTLPFQEAISLFTQMCDALSHAHKKGVIHRDLKPGNIMIVRDEDNQQVIKLLDFGLARILPTDDRTVLQLTQPGMVFGTPHYMSPEQCMGVAVDARSDIYALGCIMYETLTGENAVQGDNFYQICQFHMGGTPHKFDTLLPRHRMPPPALEKVILRTLQRKPDDRQNSMAQVKTELLEVFGPSRESTRGPVRAAIEEPSLRHLSHSDSSFLLSDEHNRVQHAAEREPDEQELQLIGRLQDAEKSFGVTSEETMPCLEALGQYYKDLELYVEAESIYRKLETLVLSKYGENSLWFANVQEQVGFVAFMQERYEDALKHYGQARQVYCDIKTASAVDLAWIDYFLHQTYDRLGEYERAGIMLDRATDTLARADNENPERLISWLTDGGRFYEKLQQDARAEEYYLKALSEAENALGERHEQLIDPNLIVGDFFVLIGESAKAEPYYRRATNIAHKTLPPMDEKFAATLFKTGAFYYKLADYAKARKCFITTLSIDEHNRGLRSVENVYTLQYLGLILDTQGDHSGAEKCFVRSIDIAEEHEGPDSERLISLRRDLGYCAENLKQYERAENELRRSLALAFQLHKDQPKELVDPLLDLGRFLSRRKKFEQSEQVLKDAIETIEVVHGVESSLLPPALDELALVFRYIGRIDESLSLELRARKIESNL